MTPPVVSDVLPAAENISVTINGVKYDGEFGPSSHKVLWSAFAPNTMWLDLYSSDDIFRSFAERLPPSPLAADGNQSHLPGGRLWSMHRPSGVSRRFRTDHPAFSQLGKLEESGIEALM